MSIQGAVDPATDRPAVAAPTAPTATGVPHAVASPSPAAVSGEPITFERGGPGRGSDPPYRHWRVSTEGGVATVVLQSDPGGGLRSDYQLRLNSYDLAVDIELYDIGQRLRFEHPEVHAVVLTGGLDKMFCAGANIQMLAGSTHVHKVNFCKFTNETRNAIEDASAHSGQVWLAALNGTAAGGGYELALACEDIILVHDRASAVSLPEVALLGVLPGTGGLTRVVDKRKVRRDLADVFATRTEGVKARQALEWGLVDAIAPRSTFNETVAVRAQRQAARSDRPSSAADAVTMHPLQVVRQGDTRRYPHLHVVIDRNERVATITLLGPEPADAGEAQARLAAAGANYWPLALCRELDDALLHLRFNEADIGTWVLRSEGRPEDVMAVDDALQQAGDHWLVREIRLFWARTLRRLDLSARTLIALIEPGSCFAGTLAELAWAADRTLQYLDLDEPDATNETNSAASSTAAMATLTVGVANTGWYPMTNGLSRLEGRFWGHEQQLAAAVGELGRPLTATAAAELGLVTEAVEDMDWEDQVRLLISERAGFSPDALTAMEANLRFVGPETMESKIFGRLTAWQNWVFSRPNAIGPEGALARYGSGSRPTFDRTRI